MSLMVPLVFFGVAVVSVFLIVVMFGGAFLYEMKAKKPNTLGKSVGIATIGAWLLAALANIGWLGGVITLIIWAVQTLAA